MLKTALSVLLMLFGLSKATITMDNNIKHGHDQHFFDSANNKMEYDHYYVHLIPHTHDDVGWLKNPDEYFSGTAMNTL
jgi:Glycosyl hydrolases family 38 N-terminal domain